MKKALAVVFIMGLVSAAVAQSLEDNAKVLEGKLIAPCCWSQPVAQHYSQAADEIRAEVRRMLSEGRTSDQILDYYVSKYGERILASPRPEGFNLLAYVLPYASLCLGAAAVIFILKKLRAPAPAAAKAEPAAAARDFKYSERVERELREFE